MKTKNNQKIKIIDIAKAVNKTHAAVSFWFNGLTNPSMADIEIMDKKFGIPAVAWYDIKSYILDNSQLFGRIKILRGADNGITKV